MHEKSLTKKNRKFLLFCTTFLALTVAIFAISRHSQTLNEILSSGEPYTITLNESNAPAALGTEQFNNGEGLVRYVQFSYTSAKKGVGHHVILSENGTLFNSAATRITSMKSLVAVFSGGEMSLYQGPSKTTLGNAQVLTSGATVNFETDPYYFQLTNSGTGNLSLTSLVITYSCIHVHSTITFESNRGSAVAPITQGIGTEIIVPSNPTRTGYLFSGWFSDENLTTEYTFGMMPDTDFTLYAKWAVDPEYPVLTLAQFKALNPADNNLHFVAGTVILASNDMQLIVLCDASDTLIIFGYQTSDIADSVRVGGYLQNESGLTVLKGDLESYVSVDIYSHNNPIPHAPTIMSVAVYNALDPDSPANWVVDAEINGTVAVDNSSQVVTLVDGENSLGVGIFGEANYRYVQNYQGFRVNMRGIILPNMDEAVTTLMFLFNGHPDFISLDYEGEGGDNELLTLLEGMFRGAFESPAYFPGQFVDLPASHPVVPATITYETFGTNASKYNVTTKRLASDISEELYIDVHVYVVLHETATRNFDIQLHVDPALIITIAEFQELPDSNQIPRVIHCVVLNVQATENNLVLLVADTTGIIYINTNDETIVPGDEVIAVGYKMTSNGLIFLMNDPSRTIDQIIAHGQGVPLAPIQITLADFAALDPGYVSSPYRYYELSGNLAYTNPSAPSESFFLISSGEVSIFIYPINDAARTVLSSYVNENVTLCGIALATPGGPSGTQIMLAFMAISGVTVNVS